MEQRTFNIWYVILSLAQEASPLASVPGYTGPRNYSEHTAREIDEAVKEIAAAALLLERETLAEAELRAFAGRLATPAAA